MVVEPKESYCFDFHRTFLNTKKFIDSHNACQDKLTDKLNGNCRATAELIVRLYLKQVNKELKHLRESSRNDLPGLKTYNGSLATCKGCTRRTVMNHKKRLLRSGFLIRENSHGASGVELHINPKILSGAGFDSVEIGSEIERLSIAGIVKNFHPLVHEQQEQKNNNSSVDNGLGVRQKAHSSGLDKSEPSGTQEHDKNTKKDADSTPKMLSKMEEGVDRIFLKNIVSDFWQFSRKILFPQIILSEPEEKDIKNMIWASVYNKFHGASSVDEWKKYHDQSFERIIMVCKWLERSPDHWIPKPHIYFSPNNDKNGFQKTLKWLIKRNILKLELKKQLAFQKIIHEQKLHCDGKGRNRTLSRLQLYRIHEQRVQRMNDPVLLDTYYKSLVSNNILK